MTGRTPGGEILVYEAPDGGVRVEVKLDRDPVWLTQRQMSELFDTMPENVLMHLKKIYAEGELEEPATAKDFLAVRLQGKRQVQRQWKHYYLDAIRSVGYPPDKQEEGDPKGARPGRAALRGIGAGVRRARQRPSRRCGSASASVLRALGRAFECLRRQVIGRRGNIVESRSSRASSGIASRDGARPTVRPQSAQTAREAPMMTAMLARAAASGGAPRHAK